MYQIDLEQWMLRRSCRFGANITDVREFLSRNPDANNINGAPETAAAKFLINSEY
jgi:iron complex outermembrane receptor protein